MPLRTQHTHLDVPFVARPPGFAPPISLRPPRPGKREDWPARSFAGEARRLPFAQLDVCCKRRPVNPQRRFCISSFTIVFPHRLQLRETRLLKGIRPVRVEQFRRTDAPFTDGALNPRQSYFQTLRV